jgi:hypothetical protein
MPRKQRPLNVPLKFKLETLGNIILSDLEACRPESGITADDKQMLMARIKDLTAWIKELEGSPGEGLSPENINSRIYILDDEIEMWSLVINQEKSLSDEDRAGMVADIKRFKQWKAELSAQRKRLINGLHR